LDVAFGIAGLDGGSFVGFQFLEVEVLDEVGWRGSVSCRFRLNDRGCTPQRRERRGKLR
jgi:hypothetical protein